jgi:hypothetical protein
VTANPEPTRSILFWDEPGHMEGTALDDETPPVVRRRWFTGFGEFMRRLAMLVNLHPRRP